MRHQSAADVFSSILSLIGENKGNENVRRDCLSFQLQILLYNCTLNYFRLLNNETIIIFISRDFLQILLATRLNYYLLDV